MSRYNAREKVLNNNTDMFAKQFEERNVNSVVQYKMDPLRSLTEAEERTISTVSYTWNSGDRMWRLANRFYGDFKMWWVITQYNRIGSEMEIKPGQSILIPFPLSIVLQYVR